MNEEQQKIITEIKTLVKKLEISFEETETITEKKTDWTNGQPKERPNQS
jgi:hypothetical protein